MRAIRLQNSIRIFIELLSIYGILSTTAADAATKTYHCKPGQAATLQIVEQNGQPTEFEWEAYDAQQRSCGLSAKNNQEGQSDWKYAADGKTLVYLYNYSDGTSTSSILVDMQSIRLTRYSNRYELSLLGEGHNGHTQFCGAVTWPHIATSLTLNFSDSECAHGSNVDSSSDLPKPSSLREVHQEALKQWRMNERDEALITFEQIFHRFRPDELNGILPVQDYVALLNDYGFVLEQYYQNHEDANLLKRAISVLIYVVTLDPSRVAAYLNLADSYYFYGTQIKYVGKNDPLALARDSYTTYHDLMLNAGKEDKIPARVFERMK